MARRIERLTGQKISKAINSFLNSSKNRTKQFDLQAFGSNFLRFLEELMTPKIFFRDFLTFSGSCLRQEDDCHRTRSLLTGLVKR